jgi:hypothetical protein
MTSEHDYEIWEIIWATQFDLSIATDLVEKQRLQGMIEWERRQLEDPHEPDAIAWWEIDFTAIDRLPLQKRLRLLYEDPRKRRLRFRGYEP